MQEYNMIIRKLISSMKNALDKIYDEEKNINLPRLKFYTINFTSNSIDDIIDNYLKNSIFSEMSLNIQKIKYSLIEMVLATDLYISLNYVIKNEKNKKSDEALYKALKANIKNNSVHLLIGNYNYIEEFLGSSIFIYEATAYEKIVLFKSLSEDDIKFLANYNPFFMDEYNHYNVEINHDFLIRQITKWLKHCDEDIAFENTTIFIFNLFEIDEDIVNDIIFELLEYSDEETLFNALYENDYDTFNLILKDFYENNKDMGSQKK